MFHARTRFVDCLDGCVEVHLAHVDLGCRSSFKISDVGCALNRVATSVSKS